MTRLPGADAPSPPQLQPGTWELFSLQVRGDQGTVGESLGGTIELGPGGTITGGALIGLDGQVDTIVDGSYSTRVARRSLRPGVHRRPDAHHLRHAAARA